jgi:hypothetical protein
VEGSGTASENDFKKGIACHPETDSAFICWCDTRDGMYDSDTFSCFSGPLVGSKYRISAAAGGSSYFQLDASVWNSGRTFLILGSVTGMKPGIPLPGGQATLPINWDPFTDVMLTFINSAFFFGFYGTLSGQGTQGATLYLPPMDPAYVGIVIHFAYCLNNPFDYVSNPIAVEIVN